MSKLTESFFENTLTPTSFCHHPLRYAFKLREPQTPVNSAYNRVIANFHGFLTGCVTCFALVDNSSHTAVESQQAKELLHPCSGGCRCDFVVANPDRVQTSSDSGWLTTADLGWLRPTNTHSDPDDVLSFNFYIDIRVAQPEENTPTVDRFTDTQYGEPGSIVTRS